MSNPVWIGIDPGTKITGVGIGEIQRGSLQVYSERVMPTPKYSGDVNTRLAVLRNGLSTVLRRYREKDIRGIGIEDPFGVKGNAIVLHELLGAYVCAVFDTLGSWDIPIYRIAQPTLKKYAINKNVKRDEAIMLMSRRADKDHGFTPQTADEIMAFWCMMFAYHISNDPQEKFRLEVIRKYRKKHGLE